MPQSKIILLSLFLVGLGFFPSSTVLAQLGGGQPAPPIPFDDCPEPGTFGCFEVGLPGIPTDKTIDTFIAESGEQPVLAFINLAVNTTIAVLVIIGLISIVIGGYIYMTAAGDGSRVKLAKEWILAALFGIFLSFVSVVILNTINIYIGSGAIEPKLGQPSGSSGSGGGGGGSGNNNGGGGNGLPDNNGGNGGNGGGNGGGNNLPANQARFDNTPPPTTPQTVTIVMDGTNYYIRDANGFDQPTTLQGAIDAAKAAQGSSVDGLQVRVYGTSSARELTMIDLRNGLNNSNPPISGLKVHFSEVPIGYKQP